MQVWLWPYCAIISSAEFCPCLSSPAAVAGVKALGPAQRHAEIAAKFFREIDRYAGVASTLPVEQPSLVVERHDGTVPNVGMDIEAAGAVAPKRNEFLRRHIVARQGE